MKMKQVVNVLGAITDTGRLASDMYNLDERERYCESKGENIIVAEMDFQHYVRSSEKLADTNDKLREDLQGGFKQSVDDLDSLEAKDKIIAGLRSQVETLQEQLEEKDQQWSNYTSMLARQRDMYKSIAKESTRLKGHYYVFGGIPQDEKGREFVKYCRKHLNKVSYTLRLKPQHLKKELYGQGRAYHGANMEDSTHMRIYLDIKRGDE